MKLLHRLEVPKEQKNEKVVAKSKIMLKNILKVLDEEGHKLTDLTKAKFQIYKENTKNRFHKIEEQTKSKFEKVIDFLKGFACPKKRKPSPFKAKSE